MPESAQTMRADARRNRELIMTATRELLLEHGPDVPLDQIAERAGVSIATLYRRFVDRADLLKALVIEESESVTADIAKLTALIDSGVEWADWANAFHDMFIDARSRMAPVFVVMESDHLPFGDDLLELHERVTTLLGRLVDRAKQRGLVRSDTTAEDLMNMLASALQPLAHLTVPENVELTSRLIYVILAGLSPTATVGPLPGKPFGVSPARRIRDLRPR